MAKIKIGIDARLFGPENRGLGRYVESVARALVGAEAEIVLFMQVGSPHIEWALNSGFKVIPVLARVYSWREQTKFLKVLYEEKCDIVHFPHFNVPIFYFKPFVVTVHDLILHHFPDRRSSTLNVVLYWIKYWLFRGVFWWTVRRAKIIIAVSEYTKEDLLNRFYGLRDKVTVVSEMLDLELSTDFEKTEEIWYNKRAKYALVVGALYPHKNVARLIRVWSKLSEKNGLSLAIVAPVDKFTEHHRALAQSLAVLDTDDGVTFLPPQSNKDLSLLYKHASVLIFPSLYEGVGLPGLEALAAGLPVLSSAESVLPEVYGEAVLYLSVTTDEAMLESLNKGLQAIETVKNKQPLYPVLNLTEMKQKLMKIYSTTL